MTIDAVQRHRWRAPQATRRMTALRAPAACPAPGDRRLVGVLALRLPSGGLGRAFAGAPAGHARGDLDVAVARQAGAARVYSIVSAVNWPSAVIGMLPGWPARLQIIVAFTRPLRA